MVRNEHMNKGLIAKLAFGVSPIPLVGEVALSWGFYDILKNARDSGQSPVPPVVGFPAAILIRWGLYAEFYIPIAKQFGLLY